MMFQFQSNLELFDPFIRIGQIFGVSLVLFDVESMGLVFEVAGKIRRFGENRMITKANKPKSFLVHGNRIDILVLLGLWIVFWAIGGFYGKTHVKYLTLVQLPFRSILDNKYLNPQIRDPVSLVFEGISLTAVLDRLRLLCFIVESSGSSKSTTKGDFVS